MNSVSTVEQLVPCGASLLFALNFWKFYDTFCRLLRAGKPFFLRRRGARRNRPVVNGCC